MVGEAALRLFRAQSGNTVSGLLTFKSEMWNIALDGKVVGTLGWLETVEVSLAPGRHTLRIGQGRHICRPQTFDVRDGEVVSFRCHGPIFPPQFLAAAIIPSLWITLKRS